MAKTYFGYKAVYIKFALLLSAYKCWFWKILFALFSYIYVQVYSQSCSAWGFNWGQKQKDGWDMLKVWLG